MDEQPRKVKTVLVVIFAALFFASSAAAYYFYNKYNLIKSSIPKSTDEEVNELLSRVGRLAALPDERPTIATVTDANVLRSRPFFANAKTGDKVLIFPIAQKAILYDPTADKIVEAGPFTVQDLTGGGQKEEILAPTSTTSKIKR